MKTGKVIIALLLGFTTLLNWSIAGSSNTPNQGYSIYIPQILKYLKPSTVSRYMQTTDINTLYEEGHMQANQNGVIVLYFGPPRINSSTYGTFLYDYTSFASVASIEIAVEAFITGLWEGSQLNPDAFFIVAVGTSNCGSGNGPNYCNPGDNVTYGHGQAWADMLDNIDSFIASHNYSSKIQIAGAIDVESSWNSTQNTRDWIRGYVENTSILYYNFGTCDGCPTVGEPNCSNNGGYIANNWTLEDIRYMSAGEPESWPLPEIYRTDKTNAQQWYRVSLYSNICHNGLKLPFRGVMSEWQACQDNDPGSCRIQGIDNQPSEAWMQLWNLISNDTRTSISSMPWLTDISWHN